jgi:hypothetical protein
VLAVGAGDATAAKRARADLKISSVSAPTGPVAAGASFSVPVKTRNAGRRRSLASRTALYLSSDAKKSPNDVRVGAISIGGLNPGKATRKSIHATIPAFTPAGRYRLLACADNARRVHEVSERNNCRAASGTLTVTAGGGPGGTGPAPDDDSDGYPNANDCAPNDPSVHPGAADGPDVPAFRDTNCDGIDGDAAHAVFVSPVGSDASPGTQAKPKRTMANAVVAAASQGKDVYATAGIYTERLVVADGVGVYGGYGVNWSRSLSNETRLTGGGTGEGAFAFNLTNTTTLQHITLAPDAPGGAGSSSYGLRAINSGDLVIERVVATGARGAAGSNGSTGPNGTAGVKGVDGGNGNTPGAGGTSVAGRPGGHGGFGASGPGEDGQDGTIPPPAGGGGPGGPGGVLTAGGAGQTGAFGANGAHGSGGFGGTVAGNAWQSSAGLAGLTGSPGDGGGGGGGGGGPSGGDSSTQGWAGGGGGGGGSGGEGGGGGTGGGGSFGLFLVNSPGVVVTNSTIAASNGGAGGFGGDRGFPGSGGPRGLGELDSHGHGRNGGNGGIGGSGGFGGWGGGGAGGPSIALFRLNSPVTTSGNTLTFGSGGAGGGSQGTGAGGAGAAGQTN